MDFKEYNSNSTVAVRVEANLPGDPLPVQFFYNKCIIRKCFTLKMKAKVTEYSIHNGAIRWWINLCKSYMMYFC